MPERSNKYFRDYISRFFHKASSVITGLVGFFVPAIFELLFPEVFNFYIYLVIIGISFFVSGYFVYVDVVNEHQTAIQKFEKNIETLEDQLQKIESSQPNIVIGLKETDLLYVPKSSLSLSALPPRPHTEEILNEKKIELLSKLKNVSRDDMTKELKMPRFDISGVLANSASIFYTQSSKGYEKRVEEFLLAYEEYLNELYDFSIFKERYKIIRPVIENISPFLATKVIIELLLPDTLVFPPNSIDDLVNLSRMMGGRDVRPPSPPKEPQLFEIKELTNNWMLTSSRKSRQPAPDGLKIITRAGKRYVIYEFENVIQNRPINLTQIPVWLGAFVGSTTWNIPVKIWAAELRQPIECSLAIEIVALEDTPSAS